MRLLLDECVDRRFADELAGHEVKTVPQMGWATKKNGELLTLAEPLFDVFITADRNLSYQQDLSRYDIAVVVLKAPSNRLHDLRPLATRVLDAIPAAPRGQATVVS